MKKLRKMLGKADSDYILELMKLIETQSKETIAKWCLDYAEEFLIPLFKKHCPNDFRPQMAIDAARDWLNGKKKLPEVKNIILNECHAAARELDDNPVAQACARAIGQASAVIHTPTHSLGIAFYGAAAIAYEKLGLEADDKTYDDFARKEVKKMTEALRKISVKDEVNKAKIKWYC